MSKKDATPSLSPDAAIPEHLRAKVRVAAEWRVVNACKTVTVPQQSTPCAMPSTSWTGFDSGDLPAETLIELGKEAIDWWMPDARPHTTEQWQELLDDLDPIRELVAMIEHMAEMRDR